MPGWRSQKIRRPRAEVQPFVDLLVSEMPEVEYHLLGSWRRGAQVIGDIDVLIVTSNGELNGSLFEPGVILPRSVDWQRHGPKVAQGDLWIGDEAIHIDFWSCKPNERGAYLCFATGPMELNLIMRQRAIRQGYALSQIGLLDRETKRQLDDGTEEDVFRWIGMDYLTPEQRERFTKPKQATPRPYPPQQKPRSQEDMPAPRKATTTVARKATAKQTAEEVWTNAPTEAAEKATPAAVKVEPTEKENDATLDIGGITVTIAEAKKALEVLTRSKSMMVRQPLVAAASKLSRTDYHAVAALWFAAHPADRKKTHPTKNAFIEQVKLMIAKAEGQPGA